jgi:Icc-related predicted phosphoesterase
MMLRYPGWEAEYRLKMLGELEPQQSVLLFWTPPAHKGRGREGSAVVAELVNTHRPKLVVVGGDEPSEEELGTALVVCPGRLADGHYSIVDLTTSIVSRRELPAEVNA